MDIIQTIIILGIAITIGIVNDKTKPKEYYYEDRIVTVYKKYQCPYYCKTDHYHYVYYDSIIVDHGRMYIDKWKKECGHQCDCTCDDFDKNHKSL